MEALRGSQISLIFQDPNTSFNPYMTIGKQLEQAFRVHNKKAGKEECRQAVKDALKLVGLNNWEEIIKMLSLSVFGRLPAEDFHCHGDDLQAGSSDRG